MSIDFAKLAIQGRAKSPSQAWEPEELEALILLEKGRNIPRTRAADYIRNGITTLEDFDKAVEAEFVPLSQDEATQKAAEDLKKRGEEVVKVKKTRDKKIK